MFGHIYSRNAEASQARKEAAVYLGAARAALDPELRSIYRAQFRACRDFARALEA